MGFYPFLIFRYVIVSIDYLVNPRNDGKTNVDYIFIKFIIKYLKFFSQDVKNVNTKNTLSISIRYLFIFEVL